MKANGDRSQRTKQVNSMLMKPVFPTAKRGVVCSYRDFRLYFNDNLFYAFRLVPFIWHHTVWQLMMNLLALIAPHSADDEQPMISGPAYDLPLPTTDYMHLIPTTGRGDRFCTSN